MEGYAWSDVAAMREIGRDRQLVRLNQDMTQQALAVQTGVSRSAIGPVENGRPASTRALVQLLRAPGRSDVPEVLEGSAAILTRPNRSGTIRCARGRGPRAASTGSAGRESGVRQRVSRHATWESE